MHKRFLVISCGLIVLVGVGVYQAAKEFGFLHTSIQSTPASPDTPSTSYPTVDVPYTIEEVARDLYVPWSIVFPSNDRIYITERNGSIRVVSNGELQEKPIITINDVSTQSEEGLMGMTLDPSYQTNRFLYVCYAYEQGSALYDTVVRYTDKDGTFSEKKTIIDRIPAARFHAGCRIKFGPDNKLYVTTGDATDKASAQDVNSLAGKILRLNADGTIPSDNPFPNSPVYSVGHRNPQGIDWNKQTGDLWATEHGPSGNDGPGGGDEVNHISAGKNYGWPIVSHNQQQSGFVSPKLVFTPAIAPASGMFYSGKTFPQWRNNFFFGMLRGNGVMRIVLDQKDPTTVVSFHKADDVSFGRIREIVEAPDGTIYFSTSNTDGRGIKRSGDDKVLRIVPIATP